MDVKTAAHSVSADMSLDRLRRADDHLQRNYIDTGRFPGTQLTVFRRGELVHQYSQGLADVARKTPVRDDTIFRIYSMTKPITTVAFMMLVEEGRVAIDEPVAKYIPAWSNLGVYVGGIAPLFQTRAPTWPMLIIDLLRHTSGLTYGFQQRSNVDAAYREKKIGVVDQTATLDEMMTQLASIPLEFSPGEAWNYSVSTDVIGYLVGRISGIPFEQFLKARIFEPLGMTDTDFHVSADKVHRFAACYLADGRGGMTLHDDPTTSAYLKPPVFVSGGGGLCSTSADYLTFCRMLLNGGSLNGVRLLGPKTIRLMTSNHLPGGRDLTELSKSMFSEATYAGIGFGLGFSVTMNPHTTMIAGTAGEFAWGGLATTSFWIDPVEELIVIFMTQVIPSSAYAVRRELRTMIYSAISDSNRLSACDSGTRALWPPSAAGRWRHFRIAAMQSVVSVTSRSASFGPSESAIKAPSAIVNAAKPLDLKRIGLSIRMSRGSRTSAALKHLVALLRTIR